MIKYTNQEIKSLRKATYKKPNFLVDPETLEINFDCPSLEERQKAFRTSRSRKYDTKVNTRLLETLTENFYLEKVLNPAILTIGVGTKQIAAIKNSKPKVKEDYLKKLHILTKKSIFNNYNFLSKFLPVIKGMLIDNRTHELISDLEHILQKVSLNEKDDFSNFMKELQDLDLLAKDNLCPRVPLVPTPASSKKPKKYIKIPNISEFNLNQKTQIGYDIDKMRAYCIRILAILKSVNFQLPSTNFLAENKLELETLNRMISSCPPLHLENDGYKISPTWTSNSNFTTPAKEKNSSIQSKITIIDKSNNDNFLSFADQLKKTSYQDKGPGLSHSDLDLENRPINLTREDDLIARDHINQMPNFTELKTEETSSSSGYDSVEKSVEKLDRANSSCVQSQGSPAASSCGGQCHHSRTPSDEEIDQQIKNIFNCHKSNVEKVTSECEFSPTSGLTPIGRIPVRPAYPGRYGPGPNPSNVPPEPRAIGPIGQISIAQKIGQQDRQINPGPMGPTHQFQLSPLPLATQINNKSPTINQQRLTLPEANIIKGQIFSSPHTLSQNFNRQGGPNGTSGPNRLNGFYGGGTYRSTSMTPHLQVGGPVQGQWPGNRNQISPIGPPVRKFVVDENVINYYNAILIDAKKKKSENLELRTENEALKRALGDTNVKFNNLRAQYMHFYTHYYRSSHHDRCQMMN